MSLSSMTGFARAQGAHGAWRWSVELKCVNAKGLDLRLRLPPGFDRIEAEARARLAKALSRGTLFANVSAAREGAGVSVRVDGALLAGYFRGANVDIGNEYQLLSIAVVVIGGTSVAGGKANAPGVWGGALFLVLLQTMLNTYGVGARLRLLLTGVIIVAIIAAAGGEKAGR